MKVVVLIAVALATTGCKSYKSTHALVTDTNRVVPNFLPDRFGVRSAVQSSDDKSHYTFVRVGNHIRLEKLVGKDGKETPFSDNKGNSVVYGVDFFDHRRTSEGHQTYLAHIFLDKASKFVNAKEQADAEKPFGTEAGFLCCYGLVQFLSPTKAAVVGEAINAEEWAALIQTNDDIGALARNGEAYERGNDTYVETTDAMYTVATATIAKTPAVIFVITPLPAKTR